MIVFIDSPQAIQDFEDRFPRETYAVLNLSSLYSGYTNITGIMTNLAYIHNTDDHPMQDWVGSPEFDNKFAAMMMTNYLSFSNFMQIMTRVREGVNVLILVQRDPYRDAVMESLIKFIQQRYGYNSWIVESPEDMQYIHETPLTPSGLEALDHDVEQYTIRSSQGKVDWILPNVNIE